MSTEQALCVAQKYGLEDEVRREIENGYSPEEALAEWDIL